MPEANAWWLSSWRSAVTPSLTQQIPVLRKWIKIEPVEERAIADRPVQPVLGDTRRGEWGAVSDGSGGGLALVPASFGAGCYSPGPP